MAGQQQREQRARTEDGRAGESRRHENRPQAAANPFLVDDEDILPRIPDDEEFAYKWMRGLLGGEMDGRNYIAHTTGKLAYEIVRPDQMPDLKPLALKHAHAGPCIQINDCILVRIPKVLRDLYLNAMNTKADQLAGALKAQVEENISDKRARLVEYEDRAERVRDVSALEREDDEAAADDDKD